MDGKAALGALALAAIGAIAIFGNEQPRKRVNPKSKAKKRTKKLAIAGNQNGDCKCPESTITEIGEQANAA